MKSQRVLHRRSGTLEKGWSNVDQEVVRENSMDVVHHSSEFLPALSSFSKEAGVIVSRHQSIEAEHVRILSTLVKTRSFMKSAVQSRSITGNTSDAPSLQHTAHKLKSTSTILGTLMLADPCQELEALNRIQTIVEPTSLLSTIKNEYACVCTALSSPLEVLGRILR